MRIVQQRTLKKHAGGRPPLPEEEKIKSHHLRIEKSRYEVLKKAADELHVTPRELAETLITDHLDTGVIQGT